MSLRDPCGMQREKHGGYQGQKSRSRQCPTRERVDAIYLLFQNAGTRSPRIKQVKMFCCWDRTTKQDKTREDQTGQEIGSTVCRVIALTASEKRHFISRTVRLHNLRTRTDEWEISIMEKIKEIVC